MQPTMALKACAGCGQPISSGEFHVQTASVDIVDGRAVSSPVQFYHLKGHCYGDAKRGKHIPNAA